MTTRDRPNLMYPLVENIRAVTPEPYRLLFLVDDESSHVILDGLGVENYLTVQPTTVVQKVNRMVIATSEPYFYWGADDTSFTAGWLEAALAKVKETRGVVGLNDGAGSYDTAIISRDYIDHHGTIEMPGLVFYPGYKHFYCEVELYQTAKMRGKLDYAPDAIVIHNHWTNGRAPKDNTYKIALNWAARDRVLFYYRAPLWGGSTEHLGKPGQHFPI